MPPEKSWSNHTGSIFTPKISVMHYLLMILCLSVSLAAFAQKTNLNSHVSENPQYSLEDTLISVTYHKEDIPGLPPAIFINGTFQNVLLKGGINLEKVADIRINKDTVEIDNNVYYEKIMIELEKSYRPGYISVSELISKYTRLNKFPDVLMIDDEIISCNFDESYIDAHYLLRMDVSEIQSAADGDTLCIVRLLTRTAENVRKANAIYIRGTMVAF